MENIEIAILDAKDKRYNIQRYLIEKYKNPLISFSFNVPGNIKNSKNIEFSFNIFVDILHDFLKENEIDILEEKKYTNSIDNFFCCAVKNIDAKSLKEKLIKLEENLIYGRILDIDVIDENFNSISRKDFKFKARKCFLCENEAIYCIKNKSHDYNLLYDKFLEYVDMIRR